jgi:polar amino acid transport system substrate-binding protein
MKAKKTLAIVCSMLFVVTLFAGCANKTSSTTPGGLARVKQAGKLVVGLDDSYPPMEFRDEKDNLVGFDIDLGNEIGKRLGVKTEYMPTDFNGILVALTTGKFDCIISSLSITDERKKTIDFSDSYLDGGQIIIVKKSNTTINSKADLANKIVGAQLGSTGEQAASKVPGVKEVKKYDKVTEAMHDLIIGRIDCIVVDKQVGEYYIAKDAANYKVLSDTLTVEPTGIGFKKTDSDLKVAVQKAINDMKADGTLSKISIKWFGHDIYKK